jgi:hypothetical protein
VGTNVVNVACLSPAPATPTNQVTTVVGISLLVLSNATDIVTNAALGACSAEVSFTLPGTEGGCPPVTVTATLSSGATFTQETNVVTFVVGTNVVTVTAEDACGQTTNDTFKVIVRDVEPPVIDCPTNRTVSLGGTLSAPTAYDLCSGTATVTPASVTLTVGGTNSVPWTATDAAGNVATTNETVLVYAVESLSNSVVGTLVGGTNYVAWSSNGIVAVTAVFTGNLSTNGLPSDWSFTGGDYSNQVVRTVSKSSVGATTFIASVGTSARTNVVVILQMDILEAGKYIVPGSTNNTIRYCWAPTNAAPSSVRMEIYDRTNTLVRTISVLPTSFLSTNAWAEHKWNGMQDEAGTLPLAETNSPYALKIIGTWGGTECAAVTNAAVEAWLLDIGIEDKPLASETLVTGVDEESVTHSNLEVWVSLDSNTAVSVAFSVSNNTTVATGPAGNEWGCSVTPTNFLFYTTPVTPYDIRYRVTINQKTSTNSVPADGMAVQTVRDGTLNLWDMDRSTPGRQTNTVWEFGIDSSGTPPAAVRRNPTEVYQ